MKSKIKQETTPNYQNVNNTSVTHQQHNSDRWPHGSLKPFKILYIPVLLSISVDTPPASFHTIYMITWCDCVLICSYGFDP